MGTTRCSPTGAQAWRQTRRSDGCRADALFLLDFRGRRCGSSGSILGLRQMTKQPIPRCLLALRAAPAAQSQCRSLSLRRLGSLTSPPVVPESV